MPHSWKPLLLAPHRSAIQGHRHGEQDLVAFGLLDGAELLHKVVMGAMGVVVEQEEWAGFSLQRGVQEAGDPGAAVDHQIRFQCTVLPGGVYVVARRGGRGDRWWDGPSSPVRRDRSS